MNEIHIQYGIILILVLLIVSMFVVLALHKKKTKNSLKSAINRLNNRNVPLQITCAGAQAVGERENQQDSYSISDHHNTELLMRRGMLAVLADGMGGLHNGAVVSQIITSVMKTQFETTEVKAGGAIDLLTLLNQANLQVNQYIESIGGEPSGSTVVAALIVHRFLYFLSVGDSRIYLIRNGGVIQLNREHEYATALDQMAADGTIGVLDALNDNRRGSLTSYIGMGRIESVDRNINPVELVSRDKILLVSDGIFGTLTDYEILDAVEDVPVEEGVERLLRAVSNKAKPKQDNYSAVLIQMQ